MRTYRTVRYIGKTKYLKNKIADFKGYNKGNPN